MLKQKFSLIRLLCFLMIIGMIATGCSENPSASETKTPDSSGLPQETQNDWLAPYSETVVVTIGRTGSENDPKFPEGEALDNSAYSQWIKDQFNIKIQTAWLVPVGEIDTKISLEMAADDLPDVYTVRNSAQLKQMIEGEMLADLTSSVDQYSSDLMRSIFDSYGGVDIVFPSNLRDYDGNIRAFSNTPPGYEFPLTWIRQDWLKALNLETPTTFAELEAMAKAFVDNKIGGESTTGIEISGDLSDSYAFLGSPGPLYHNYGAYPGNWIREEATGELVYGSIQPQMKKALGHLMSLYHQGILDEEFATKDWTASITSGQSGILFGSWWIGAWPLNNTKANDPNTEWIPIWIPSDSGDYNVYRPHIETESTYWVVNQKFQHPEVLIKMINIASEQQNLSGIDKYDEFAKNIPMDVDTHYSEIGYKFDYHAWPVDAKVRYYDQLLRLEPMWMDLVKEVQQGNEIPEFSTESFNGQKIVDYMNGTDQSPEAFHVYAKTLSLQLIATNKDSVVEKEIYNPPVTATMEMAWSNLKDMENVTFTKIIMGEQPLDSFDTFVQDWGAQGGTQITGEVNEAAAR